MTVQTPPTTVVYSICSLVKFLFNSDKGGLHLTDLFSYSSDECWSLVKVCNCVKANHLDRLVERRDDVQIVQKLAGGGRRGSNARKEDFRGLASRSE